MALHSHRNSNVSVTWMKIQMVEENPRQLQLAPMKCATEFRMNERNERVSYSELRMDPRERNSYHYLGEVFTVTHDPDKQVATLPLIIAS